MTLPPEIRWLIQVSSHLRWLYAKQVVVVTIASILTLADPLVLKWLIDEALPSGRASWVLLAALAFFAVFLLSSGLEAWAQLIDAESTQRLSLAIRGRLLRHLQRQSADYFLHMRRGDLLHRLEADTERACQLGGRALSTILRVMVITAASVGIMTYLSWRLTVVLLLALPLMLLLRRYSHPRLVRASDEMQTAAADRSQFLEEQLAAITQVQLLDRCAGERRRFQTIQRRAMQKTMRWHGAELTFFFSSQASLMAAAAVVLGYGGSQVLAGGLTIGSLMAFYGYVYRIFGPVEMAISIYANVQRSGASIRRLMEVLDAEPTIVDPAQPVPLPRDRPLMVALRAVSFHYPDKPPVLCDLDLEIRAGEKLALVGSSGSGKTTIARLITRLYEPQRGRVELAGIDVATVALRDLRKRVALVPQEPFLFAESLVDNLRIAAPKADETAIREALEAAQLTTLAADRGHRDNARIAQRGGSLSGGQRQRVAVARALLRRPRLLVLDEATSALDGRTEARLLAALDRYLARETTVVVIAHRLSAIRWADRIAVVDGGRVVATGRHERLLATCSRYRSLCAKQLDQAGRPSVPEAAAPEAAAASGF